MKSIHKIIKPSESHRQVNWLRDVILGGQDGLVNVLGIVLGVAATGADTKILIAAALAATFAESVSMGAVAYTSTMSEKDHYEKELERERLEVETVPEKEREEIREIYMARGFSGKLLDEIIAKITSHKEAWVQVMMSEELHLAPVDTAKVLRTSVVVGLAAIVGSLVPVIPFFLLTREMAMPTSLVVSAIALFGIGVYEARTYVGSWWKRGIQMVAIGLGAALVGFFIGKLFQTPSP